MDYYHNMNYGNTFMENLDLDTELCNSIFVLLFSTIFFTFLLGNLFFLDAHVLSIGIPIVGIGAMCICIFYTIAKISKSIPWSFVSLYCLLLCVVYAHSFFVNILFYILSCIAVVYTFKFLRIPKVEILKSMVAGLVGSITILGARGMYTSFNMLERLSADNVSQDTLYHASIAAMMKNYGIASTGLHGLVETPYHILSHQLIASVSFLSGEGVLSLYGFMSQIFFIPILLFSIVFFCTLLHKENKHANVALLWGLACLLLTMIPYLFGERFGFWNSYFVSESYTVSLALLLMGLGLLYKRSLKYADIVLICVLATLMALSKASVGLIYMGLWWLRVLFFKEKEYEKILLAAVVLSIFVVSVILQSAKNGATLCQFAPFHFIANYSFWGIYIRKFYTAYIQSDFINIVFFLASLMSISLFICVHFLVSWIAVGQSIYRKSIILMWRSPVAVYSLGAMCAGILIIGLFNMHSSEYYFSNVSFFISLPTALLLMNTALSRHISNDNRHTFIILSIIAFVILIPNLKPMYHLYKEHRNLKNKQSAFIKKLINIRDDSSLNLCFMPTNVIRVQNPVTRHTAKPFVYPAVSERPWCNVVQEADPNMPYQFYGYEKYGLTPEKQRITIHPVLKVNDKRTLQFAIP